MRVDLVDDERRRHEVAGCLPSSSAASFTLYGIVIAGMKPLMSSCSTRTSLRSGSKLRIWPLSSYSPRSGARLQAAAARQQSQRWTIPPKPSRTVLNSIK